MKITIPTNPNGTFAFSSEIWTQKNIFNAKSLLAFPHTDEENQLFSYDELKTYIEKDDVTISCADDFHSNSMVIRQTDSIHYFYLEYSNEKVNIYKEKPDGRDSFE